MTAASGPAGENGERDPYWWAGPQRPRTEVAGRSRPSREPGSLQRRPADAGLHTNSTAASHAFYLAVEGGTNRTSGETVEGVGAANRDQIEQAFVRAFVYMLPSAATFGTAREATVQSARDLFGPATPPPAPSSEPGPPSA